MRQELSLLWHKLRSRQKIFLRSMLVFVPVIAMLIAYCSLDKYGLPYAVLVTVASSVLATALASWMDDKYCSGDLEGELIAKFSALQIYHDYGLITIAEKNFPLDDPSFHDGFVKSEKVIILMNDAKNFISLNYGLLLERFKYSGSNSQNRQTIFILLDYREDWLMSALNRRNGHDEGYYQAKISALIDYSFKSQLSIEAQKCNHALKLFLYGNFNTIAMILTDSYVMESTYRLAPYKSSVPHFVFARDGKEYSAAKADIEEKLLSQDSNGAYRYVKEVEL